MSVNVELANAARWVAAQPGLSDSEKALKWRELMESLDGERPSDGDKQMKILHWRQDLEREIAERMPSAPL